jgi:hypothetical protein
MPTKDYDTDFYYYINYQNSCWTDSNCYAVIDNLSQGQQKWTDLIERAVTTSLYKNGWMALVTFYKLIRSLCNDISIFKAISGLLSNLPNVSNNHNSTTTWKSKIRSRTFFKFVNRRRKNGNQTMHSVYKLVNFRQNQNTNSIKENWVGFNI